MGGKGGSNAAWVEGVLGAPNAAGEKGTKKQREKGKDGRGVTGNRVLQGTKKEDTLRQDLHFNKRRETNR